MRVMIWGTGKIAVKVWENGIGGEIQGFIETNKKRSIFKGIPVYEVQDRWPAYDYIVVANKFSDEVYETCLKENIDLSKVIFLYPVRRKLECDIESVRNVLGEKNFTDYCIAMGLFEQSFFKQDMEEYERKNERSSFKVNHDNLWPLIGDKYKKAGYLGNYFYQDLWAARLIYKTGVKKHFDIGSRIDGFIAHCLAMGIDVTMIDIRDFPAKVENLHTIVDDATTLKQITHNSIDSMSALCSLEHFGLGRYGDPVEPEACFICFQEMQKRMKDGGNLYVSLPIGKERLEFNAHRIFFPSTVINCFSDMQLVEFSCAANEKIEYNVPIHKYDNDVHNGEFRYGLFHFVKN